MKNRRPRKYKLKHLKRLGDWGHSKATERKIRPLRSYPCIPSQVFLSDTSEMFPIEELKLTRGYLEKQGFHGKYKSCHTRWCKDGLCLDQASDEDDYGNKIKEQDIFYYEQKEVRTIGELNKLRDGKL